MKTTSAVRLIAAVAVFAVPPFAQQVRKNTSWAEYLGGPDSSHYSPLKQVNTGNVSKLQVAWSYDVGDESYTFSPLVVDNIAYVAAKQGALVALDATTGKELWVHTFAGGGRFSGIGGQRGANYWESKDRSDRRILVTSSGSLFAIDARTGKLVDSFADHGRMSLASGIDRDNPPPLASRSPGRIFENLIILGSATGEGYLAPPGDIRGFDVVSGNLKWVFHTLPHPGEPGYAEWPETAYKYMGGVDVWGEITVDEKRGIAYFPVASAKYELYGGDRPGSNLYADCILALDARTGKHLWHFQTVHHDVWDYDPNAAPQLTTVKHDGRNVDAVALASKNGFLYVFDRVSGKPLWPIEERPVPQSDVPGEATAPTQPFPTVVPPFTRQGMTVKDMYDAFMTDEQKAWWKDRLSSARTGLYTPPALGDTILMPSVNGGALFFGTGAEPNGTVYVMGRNMPSIIKLVPAGESTAANTGGMIPDRPRSGRGGPALQPTIEQLGRTVYEQNCQICHGPELKGDRGPQIDNAVARLGADATRSVVTNGKGSMPPVANLAPALVDDLIAFLTKPESVPPGSAAPVAALAGGGGRRGEPPYPQGVTPPPSRYKTGYGNEPYVITPPWSLLTAYDLNTGKIKWQTPYGDLPQAGPSDKLRGNVFPKSGFVITAGGLVLFAGNDSKLYALDKETGKVIATKELPNGSLGVPAVYEVDGRQYILLAASGGNPFPAGGRLAPGGVNPPAISRSYIAFSLPAAAK